MYTSTRLKVLRACPRLHFYRYALGIAEPQSRDAHFGTVAHSALESWYLSWKRGEDQVVRLNYALAVVEQSDLDPFDRVRLEALVAAYHFRWKDAPWEVLAVEVEFRYELSGFTIGGKIDAIVRDVNTGEIWIVEHKTTKQDASPGSTYWERLALDAQVSIYVDGATVLGHEVAGCVYDVLQRPQHQRKLATPIDKRQYTQGKGCKICGGNLQGKQGTAVVKGSPCAVCRQTGWRIGADGKPESPRLYDKQRDDDETVEEFSDRVADAIATAPGDYLIRGIVVRLDDELPRMRADIIDSIKLERAAALFDLAPRNPDACSRFGQLCSFFDACANRASIDDEQRFPRGAAHPELATAA